MHPTTLPFDLLLPDEPLALDLSTLYTRLQRLPAPGQRACRFVRAWFAQIAAPLSSLRDPVLLVKGHDQACNYPGIR